jgi:uncharacterized cupin superfamily protein
MSHKPVISTHTVDLIPRPEAWRPTGAAAERFDIQRARLGPALGLKKLGCSVTQVAPGRTGYPFHSHRVNDEMFFVLAGSGELRLGDERHPVQAGDLIGCPAGGPARAHQLINTGREPLRYLAISSELDPEICEYPDSGKVGVYAGDDEKDGLVHLTRYADQVDYWQGE